MNDKEFEQLIEQFEIKQASDNYVNKAYKIIRTKSKKPKLGQHLLAASLFCSLALNVFQFKGSSNIKTNKSAQKIFVAHSITQGSIVPYAGNYDKTMTWETINE